jgi:hypothetical protein
MMCVLRSLLLTLRSCVRSRAAYSANGALRHQLQVLERSRCQWVHLSRYPGFFAFWPLLYDKRLTAGSGMNIEVRVRFWESAAVRLRRATRPGNQ